MYDLQENGVENDIAELLRKCCKVDRVALLMRSDVLLAEPEIILQIKNAIDTFKYNGIYVDGLPTETLEDYKNRHITTQLDVENYLKGVPIFE